MKICKILTGCVALCVFLYYTVGLFCFYQWQETAIKKEHIPEALWENEKEVLEELRIAIAEIQWVDKHEFYYAGELYDIVSSEHFYDTLYCIAYHDTEEQMLKDNYTAVVGGVEKDKEQKQHTFRIYPKFLAAQKIIFDYTYQFTFAKQVVHQKIDPVYIALHCPPPKV